MARSTAKRAAKRRVDEEFRAPLAPPDACGAWRRSAAGIDAAGPLMLRDEQAGVVGAVFVTLLDRLARVRATERCALAASGAHLWTSAAALTNDATLSERAALWTPDDPDLELVRRLLDVCQAVESAGWVDLGEAGLRALMALLPPLHLATDTRSAHVWANRGRALRFLGHLDEARAVFVDAQACAHRLGDLWLEARCDMGIGVIAEQRGNYPEAMSRYRAVLARFDDGSRIARAAQQGLLTVSKMSGRYDEAFAYGWQAFREAGRDAEQRIDALLQLSELCRRVGRHRAALRACQAAFVFGPPLRYVVPLHGTAMRAAEALGLFDLADEHAAQIELLLPAAVFDTYTRADAARDLAWWHATRHEVFGNLAGKARQRALEARRVATTYGYHEITFDTDALLERLDTMESTRSSEPSLARESELILDDVAALPLSEERLLAIL